MQIVAMAEANPAPSVKFHWINETMQIVKHPINVHPFVYKTVLELKNIPSYFCGKNLTTEFTNIKGSSGVVETFIDMKGKFEKESPLKCTTKGDEIGTPWQRHEKLPQSREKGRTGGEPDVVCKKLGDCGPPTPTTLPSGSMAPNHFLLPLSSATRSRVSILRRGESSVLS